MGYAAITKNSKFSESFLAHTTHYISLRCTWARFFWDQGWQQSPSQEFSWVVQEDKESSGVFHPGNELFGYIVTNHWSELVTCSIFSQGGLGSAVLPYA